MTNGNYDWDAFINAEKLQQSNNRTDQERLSLLVKNLGSTDGWKICASFLLRDESLQQIMKQLIDVEFCDFFCFRGIEEFIKSYYSNNSNGEFRELMHSFVLQYLRIYLSNEINIKNFMKNKFVQILTEVAYADYPNNWVQLFQELIGLVKSTNENIFNNDSDKMSVSGERSYELFLKILITWYSIACDKEKQTSDVLKKNTEIKDFMRENDIKGIMEIVRFAIINIGIKQQKIMKKALKTLALYISWIDIDYVADDMIVDSIILPLFKDCDNNLKAASLSCLTGIINKGMQPFYKVKLITFINDKLIGQNVWSSFLEQAKMIPEVKSDDFGCDEDEIDNCFYVTAGSLVNDMGIYLIDSYKSLKEDKNQKEISDECMKLIYNAIELALDFAYCPNNEIANTCSSVLQNFVSVLKLNYKNDIKKIRRSNGMKSSDAQLNLTEVDLVKRILLVIYNKIHYPNWYNFDKQDDFEGDFEELRKGWLTIMTNLIQLNQSIVLDYLTELTKYTVSNVDSLSFQRVEASLAMVFHLGEAVRSVKGDYFRPDCDLSLPLTEIMSLLCKSMLGKHVNCEVRIMYFELIFRFEKFFNYHSEYLVDTINLFLSEYGLKCNVMRLVTRSVYILSRLIKSHKSKFGETANSVLEEICGILSSSFQNNALLVTDDQSTVTSYSYLFESASQLIVILPNHQIAPFINQFIEPIVNQVPQLCDDWVNASRYANPLLDDTSNPHNKQAMKSANSISTAATYVNYCCRAFSSCISLSDSNCLIIFVNALDVFQTQIQAAYEKCVHPLAVGRAKINSSVRSLIHITCKSAQSDATAINAIIQRLPGFIKLFICNLHLSDFDNIVSLTAELVEIIPLYMQIINGFKENSVEFMKIYLPELFDIVKKTIDAGFNIESPTLPSETDFKEKLKDLVRLNFTLISCDISLIMLSLGSDQTIYDVLESSIGIIQNFSSNSFIDLIAIKNCVNVFQKYITNYTQTHSVTSIESVVYNCIYKRLVPFLIILPTYESFDLSDVTAALLLIDCANFQRQMLSVEVFQFSTYLREQCLIELNFSTDLINQYCHAINTSDKDFQAFLKDMYNQVKSRS